mgnify:CR=1 FL=1
MRTLPRAAAALALASALTVSGLAAAPAFASPGAASLTATTTVARLATTAVAATKITAQPVSANIRGTARATFRVKASGTKLRYQWYVKAPGKTNFAAIKGATAASYTTPAQANRTFKAQYRVVVSGSRGKVTSRAVTLSVKAYAATKITAQPKAASIRGTQIATFSVKATGEGLVYQWQVKAPGKSSYVSVKGATKASYTTPKQANKTATSAYRVLVSGKGGKATSAEARLKVTAWAKPVLTAAKAVRVEFKKGTRITVSGKNLAGASVALGSVTDQPVVLKRVSVSNTAIVLEVTSAGMVDVNRLVVSNPAGRAVADLLLMSKHAPESHAAAWDMMVDDERAIVDTFGGWESDFAADVDFAFDSVEANDTALWEPVDAFAWAVVYYARDAQEKAYDPSVSQADFEEAYELFVAAANALDELVNY